MIFDIFHSLGTTEWNRSHAQVFRELVEQARLAEALGFDTLWVAESHYSSEVQQKRHKEPVIPHYVGELGLNNDSPQLAAFLFERTRKIGFGTAIFNIVGGNGGPISAADRIRSLAFLNGLRDAPRSLRIGVATGRFPYINKPFGIVPRDAEEEALWEQYKRFIFLEALEIFLRLSNGETLASDDVTRHEISREHFAKEEAWAKARANLAALPRFSGGVPDRIPYRPRWSFEPIKLVPELEPEAAGHVRFVLGSADPLAREVGLKWADMDVFNLSFTPPDALNRVHAEMHQRYQQSGRVWHRSRMPRTVLVFCHPDKRKAEEFASRGMDVYIEGMRGTVATPPKSELLARALIGDAQMVREQLSPEDRHGFHPDDRLMLWFEFARDHEDVMAQMRYFAEEVMPHVAGSKA